ncbi:MAG: hypothetical protein SGJ23_07840 [Alphaproteobacteria bacterium]|nr:hypothetical protein [Alphaproteobacteria bacterium]
MRLLMIAPLFLLAALAACQPAPAEKAVEEDTTQAAAIPALGAFTTPAKVISITDAGYPMFVLAAQLPDRPTPVEILLNAEAADLGDVERDQFVGKDVTLTYEVVAENDLFDLRDGDLSLLQDAPARAPHWKEIVGVLTGAEHSTGGDLPDTIAVTDAPGTKVEFEYYVTPQISAANGKQVTAWYSASTGQYVKTLRLAATAPK